MDRHRLVVEQMFSGIGVAINGTHPWDIQVKDERVFGRILREKKLGLGESYMEGWWDCPRLDDLICRIIRGNLEEKIRGNLKLLIPFVQAFLFNIQSLKRARQVAEEHYDLDNDFFLSFLDPYNQYSCGYFKGTGDLHQAQINKMDLI